MTPAPNIDRRRAVLTARCITALLATLACAASADTIVLKEEAYVKGPVVLLGDVAEIDGDNKEFLEVVEVAPAALPGDCRRVNAALVMSRVRNAGVSLDGLEVTGARIVRATTLHRDVPAAQIAENLRAFVEAAMPWDPLDTEIDVVPPAKDLVVPDGKIEMTWRPSPQYQYLGAGTFRGTLSVDGQVQASLNCRVTVESYGDVVVARADIPRGKLVGAADLVTEKYRLSDLKAGSFQSPEDLVGLVARATIFPGQVITAQKVRPRIVIKRNQIVTVEARIGRLLLQTRARARADACLGDLVVCVNLDSKEEFQGVVRKDGVVSVD